MTERDPMLIKNGLLVSPNSGDQTTRADLFVQDGRIRRIGRHEGGFSGRSIDAAGLWVLPGFVQTHVHLCQTLFRGLADDLELLDWLRRRIWPLEASHDDASIYWSARLGIAELLRSGTTSVLTMESVRHTDAVFRAIRDAGIRAIAGKCIMDMGDIPGPLRQDSREALRESVDLLREWNGRENGRIRYAFAPRFALSCTRQMLEEIAREAAAAGVLVHTHAAENRQEVELVRDQTGLGNVEYFHHIGLAGDNLFLAHCIWLSDEELRLMRDSQTRITHCPGSNLKLASGIADITRYRESGLRVSLGADGAACNNTLSIFQEMKLAGLLQTLKHGAAAIAAPDIFRMATIDGARDLNLESEIGSLEEGKRADIVLFDPRGLALEGHEDVYSTLVYAGAAENVTHVIVDGRLLIEWGRPVGVDPAELARRSGEELRRLLPRAEALGFH